MNSRQEDFAKIACGHFQSVRRKEGAHSTQGFFFHCPLFEGHCKSASSRPGLGRCAAVEQVCRFLKSRFKRDSLCDAINFKKDSVHNCDAIDLFKVFPGGFILLDNMKFKMFSLAK